MGAESDLGGAGNSSARQVPPSSVHLPPQSTIPPLKFSSSSLGLPPSGTRLLFKISTALPALCSNRGNVVDDSGPGSHMSS